jgi:hypothetical protein
MRSHDASVTKPLEPGPVSPETESV